MESLGFREPGPVIQIPSGPFPSLRTFPSLISTCKHIDNTYYIWPSVVKKKKYFESLVK